MATKHEIVGEEWLERASELAEWTMDHLVNRKDVWGQYSVLTPTEQRTLNRSYKAMTLPQKDKRGKDRVTLDKLIRHYSSRHLRKPQIIGLHAKSQSTTSKWFGIDIDCHDTEATTAEDHARRNLNAAVSWWHELQDMGYDPLLLDSNGAGGGYHLWVLFQDPAPTEDVYAFAKSFTERWEEAQLDEEPETFPKRVKPDSIGSWFRLPGLHHTNEHYSTVWSGDEWLSDPWLAGHAAIDVILQSVPGPPPPMTSAMSNDTGTTSRHEKPTHEVSRTAHNRRRSYARTQKPTICIDLDGVLCSRTYIGALNEFGEPVDGALEFTQTLAKHANIIVYSARFSGQSPEKTRALKEAMTLWLEAHHFSFDEICIDKAKPIASAYIDDRAVSCQPEIAGPVAFEIAETAVMELISTE
ncbi:MAG: hypothetical protein KTR35_07535 [Gammaproteobacteria bacterium]|nr:hypothetical protein [Gammaproteobacteria bacterium]